MAALIKKRALAEYSQSQTLVESSSTPPPSEQPKPKKLRITRKPVNVNGGDTPSIALENEINILDNCDNVNDQFRTLSRIVSLLPSNEVNEGALRKILLAILKNDKNKSSALRSKCFSMLQLLKNSQSDLLMMYDEITKIISKDKSHLVIITGLTVALKFARIINDPLINKRLLSIAKITIRNSDSKIKCKCLEIMGTLIVDFENSETVNEQMKFVHAYSHSQDPRIRACAFKTMLELHEKGAELDVEVYTEVIKYLDDDYESVKLSATQLLWAISQSSPEKLIVIPESEEKIRLIDDAFAKICHVVSDPSVQVRVLAAQLLGKMPQVGPNFLDQTLDKKLMSDMRKKRSAHELQWEKVKAGEWSSGKKWDDDAPKESIDPDSISLINSGSAGAFIHGLEDEFMEVRSAAVDSLCTLALKSPEFANLALDFLVDMFNDEIEEVRIKAIDSLTKISKHISLWEDQLEIILSVLKDKSIDIREGLHKLLSSCRLMTKDCVKMCLDNLLENLKKYPQDKKSIWKSFEGLGKNHPWLILPLVPQLLSQHAFFDVAETDPEDPAYVSVLIMVFNAAKNCSTMATLFEIKIIRHYDYLRDTLPNLVPDLSLGKYSTQKSTQLEDSTSITPFNSNKVSSTNGRLLLKELVGKLKNSQNLTPEMRIKLNKLILRDLKRLAEVDKEISSVAKFTALHIRAQFVYTNCIESLNWKELTQSTQNENVLQQTKSFLQLCLKLQYGFSGLNPTEYAIIIQLKLRALALQLVYIVRGSNASALAICHNLLEHAEIVQNYLEKYDLEPDAFTVMFFKTLNDLDDPKPGTLAKYLLPTFESYPIPFVSFSSSVRIATSTITGESDTPLKFTAGLLLGIQFDADISDVQDLSLVRICVKYPDQQVHLICPRLGDFRSISNDETRLLTTVNVSHQAWTEACPILLSVVLNVSGPETNFSRRLVGKNDPTYTIQLSEERSVWISPKPPKRGI